MGNKGREQHVRKHRRSIHLECSARRWGENRGYEGRVRKLNTASGQMQSQHFLKGEENDQICFSEGLLHVL